MLDILRNHADDRYTSYRKEEQWHSSNGFGEVEVKRESFIQVYATDVLPDEESSEALASMLQEMTSTKETFDDWADTMTEYELVWTLLYLRY